MVQGANNLNAFIPEIWSKRLAVVEKQQISFQNDFANREWEGEIKSFGDTVRISLPDPENIYIGEGIVTDPSAVHPTQRVLVIDKSKNVSFKFNDIEKAQTQFNITDGYMAIGLQKIADMISLELEEEVFNDANVTFFGGSLAAGTIADPVDLTVYNAYDWAVDLKMELVQRGVLSRDGYYRFKGNTEETLKLSPMLNITPKTYGVLLKTRQLIHPTANGDDILKTGERSMIAGFEIIVDNYMVNIDGTTDVLQPYIAGTKMGITFATQFSEVESLRDPDSFATIVRALQLYGYKIIHPLSLIKGWVNVATPYAVPAVTTTGAVNP